MVSAAARVTKAAAPWVLACGFLLCLAGFPGEFTSADGSVHLHFPSVSFLLFIMRPVRLHFLLFSNNGCMVLLLLALSDGVFVDEQFTCTFFFVCLVSSEVDGFLILLCLLQYVFRSLFPILFLQFTPHSNLFPVTCLGV